MNLLKILLFTIGLVMVSQAKAGFITINESALDGIFSQSSFGNSPIDIRIGLATELVFPDLLDISTSAEVTELFDQHVGPFDLVNFYFIDTISACGGFTGNNIVGCGEVNGNNFVVESLFAGGASGNELLAHELGHNLGLSHRTGGLMNPSLNNNTSLSSNEVSTIRGSRLVQGDTQNGFFININPVLIIAAASTPVPEPSTLLLLLLSVSFLVRKNHKKRSYNI